MVTASNIITLYNIIEDQWMMFTDYTTSTHGKVIAYTDYLVEY